MARYDAAVVAKIPGDIVLEPDEHVLLATKPLAFWTPAALLIALLWAVAFARVASGQLDFAVEAVVAVAVTVVLGFAWLRWRGRWFVLTNRRVITRSGVLNRTQSAILIERLQDVTLVRPFPLSAVRGYGIVELESAGKESAERLAMEHADEFHRRLTDALTPA